MTTHSTNIQTVLEILEDERSGRVKEALAKMTSDYSMTWVYQKSNGELFPKSENNMETELEEVYHIKGREYDIKNITESEHVVMVELVESYPDPDTGKVYRTPLVLVLEMENGKIKRGRHYCDPKVSYLFLSKEEVDKIFNK
jgi:ketosteroid isomerase-like protein